MRKPRMGSIEEPVSQKGVLVLGGFRKSGKESRDKGTVRVFCGKENRQIFA